VPERPDHGDVVWVAGEWKYHGDVFAWQRGGWVAPPPGGQFAAWRTWYRRDGRLMMAGGAWYDEEGRRLPTPETIRHATTPPNEFTSEFQTAR